MYFSLKKILQTIIFNSSLFLILMVGIQNSSNKSKINFIINETVELPISFVIGISFIAGSFFGNILPLNIPYKK